MRTTRLLYLAALLVLPAGGCEQEAGPLVAVRGKVLYQGVPLHTGTIVFSPDPLHGMSGPLASAEIQSDGTFRLRTGTAWGARAGWYRVTVLAVETSRGMTHPRSLLPERYSDPELSGLGHEVKAGEENVLNLRLE